MSKTDGGHEFVAQMHQTVERAVLDEIRKGSWLTIDYKSRVQIDLPTLRSIYEGVDMERVKAVVRERLESMIADKILNAMATEIATDVKQILSQRELREDVRAIIRDKIREADAMLREGDR